MKTIFNRRFIMEDETKVYEMKKKINQSFEEQFEEQRTKVYHSALIEEPVKPAIIRPILPASKPVVRKEDKITVLKHKRKFNFLEWIDDHSWKIGIMIPLCFIILMSLVALIK